MRICKHSQNVLSSKHFNAKIIADNPKTAKSAKIFPLEIFRLYGTLGKPLCTQMTYLGIIKLVGDLIT